jgi:hypothetical protein
MAPATKVRRELVQPREPSTGTFEGDAFVLSPSEIFAADHPIVRQFPHLFRPVRESRPAVEQATAAPGELRGEPR